MKLTDNEIRDIVKLLEADKPLPDKFRFLLFEDKREVELERQEQRGLQHCPAFSGDRAGGRAARQEGGGHGVADNKEKI